MRTSTGVKALMVTFSVLTLSACGGRDDAGPGGADSSRLDSSGDGTAVPDDTGGADSADGTDIADVDDVVMAIDAPADAAAEVVAADTTAGDAPDSTGHCILTCQGQIPAYEGPCVPG